MWDFTNAGAADPNYNLAHFGYRNLMGGVSYYVFGMRFRRTRSGVAGALFCQVDNRIAWGVGCVIAIAGAGGDQLSVNHDNVFSALSPVIAINTNYSYLIVWNTGAGLLVFRNGVLWHTDAAFLTIPTVPTSIGTTIGSDLKPLLRGPPGQLGNVAVWPNTWMAAPDAVMWHNGIMPHRGSVRFFHRCTELPGKDEYERQIPDCYNAYDATSYPRRLPLIFQDDVSLYSDPSDDYYLLHGETPHEEMQILAGEELHRRRLIKKVYQITVPTEFLAEELMEDLQVTHKGGLECTGEGFGYGDAPERLVRIEGMALSPEDRTVSLTLRDIKRQAVSYYNSFRAPFTITGRQLGVFQLLPTYTAKETIRQSYSWGQDLNGIYQEFGHDQEPLTGEGLLVESAKKNYFANGTFKHQLTSWVNADAGAGVSTAMAPTVAAFDSSISGYAIRMVAGAPFGANYACIYQVLTGPGPGTDATFSFIYYAYSGNPMFLAVSRLSDGWWLQTLTGGWAAPITGLYPPIETSYKRPERYVMPYVFDGNDTYTFYFYAYGVDNTIVWLYQAQFEEGKFATGPVTNESGNTLVRFGTIVQLRNPDGLLLPKLRGTIAFEFVPLWDQDENTGTKYLCRLEHDANNYIEIHWDGTDLVARFRYNAVNQDTALLAPTWGAGDTLKLGIRWLAAGELGKGSAQGQLFVKIGSAAWQETIAVKFTQALQALTESIFYMGSHGGTINVHNAADGYLRYLHCFPEALPFEEIQALLGEAV